MVEQTTRAEEVKAEASASAQPKKKTAMGKFLNFLAYGGWLLILIVGVVLAIVISIMTSKPA